LVRIRDLLAAARQVVAAGWVQDAWFVCDDEHGRHHRVDLVQARRMENAPVARACLIGAILHANGGVATVDTQLVQRTFDLTWHTLHRRDDEPVRWCPAPPLRAQQLRDLIQWNDRSGRSRTDVQELLSSAQRTADRDIARTRQQLEAASLQ
jgi:hypothetical protein